LEVYGDNTSVLHAIQYDKIVLYGFSQEPQEWNLDVKGTKVWGHRQADEHFIECILHKKQPKVSVEDAIKAQEVAQKITKSLR
jgi:predicted dehydrogenase